MPHINTHRHDRLARALTIAAGQGGVVTLAQALAAGMTHAEIRTLCRHNTWRRVFRGIYATASATPPTPLMLAWAARLAAGPGVVVTGLVAGHLWGLPGLTLPRPRDLAVLLPNPSDTRSMPSIRVRRLNNPAPLAHATRVPRVTTVEHTVIDMAAWSAHEIDAFEHVAAACRERHTTATRLLKALDQWPRLPRGRRGLIRIACGDLGGGVTSVLERDFRNRVERPHGLPRAQRQARARSTAGGRIYRDVHYSGFGVVVELDGVAGHASATDRRRDQFRDNETMLHSTTTLRFGWLAVHHSTCAVADQVARALRQGGWGGTPRRCGPQCSVGTDA